MNETQNKEQCVICSAKLKFTNTPTFGKGNLGDGNTVCSSCFMKINRKNPRVSSKLRNYTTETIQDILQNKTIQSEEQPQKKQASKKQTAFGCFIMIIIAVFVVWLIYPKGERGEKIDAWVTTQSYVKQHLKAPASAQFPPYQKELVQKTTENSYKIVSYVDAQNSFGALIRSTYTIRLHKEGKDWYCDYFEFNGEMVK